MSNTKSSSGITPSADQHITDSDMWQVYCRLRHLVGDSAGVADSMDVDACLAWFDEGEAEKTLTTVQSVA